MLLLLAGFIGCWSVCLLVAIYFTAHTAMSTETELHGQCALFNFTRLLVISRQLYC